MGAPRRGERVWNDEWYRLNLDMAGAGVWGYQCACGEVIDGGDAGLMVHWASNTGCWKRETRIWRR